MNRLSVFAAGLRDRVTRATLTRAPSGLDFQDVSPPHGNGSAFASRGAASAAAANRAVAVPQPIFPKPLNLRRNETEVARLQGLMRQRTTDTLYSTAPDEHSRAPDAQSIKEKLNHWFINEGGRRTFFALWVLLHVLVFAFGFVHYQLKDNLDNARATFGWTFATARASALVLHVDIAMLLIPVCRNFITLIRRTYLNSLIPFDANITLHKAIGWSIVFFSLVHTLAHMRNFVLFASATGTGVGGFFLANFATGPGLTGWIMWLALGVMVFFAREKRRRANFEKFWYTHHLFVVFFAGWQLHGMFCMIQPDRPPYCDAWQVGVFWKYVGFALLLFVGERVLREVRARHRTYISKVVQHPGGVVEVHIKKEKTEQRAGQYIFINCPQISYFQWHPFTLTSCPEEDYLSVNIKMVGDWTKAFGSALGCELGPEGKKGKADGGKKETKIDSQGKKALFMNRVLPRIMIDGPFGSASEDFHKFETILLVGAGIGVTPYASILKSIWYRMSEASDQKRTRLSKVYFVHICRDTESISWFRSVLAAIEAKDTNGSVEIMTYVTQKMKDDDLTNIMVSDVGSEKDAISGLRAPTHYGRPNWDLIFQSIRSKHPSTECGVMFCGPKVREAEQRTLGAMITYEHEN